jgi:hypothetical protein
MPHVSIAGKAPTMSSMPPPSNTTASTDTAPIIFPDAPERDRAVKDQIVALLPRIGLAAAAASIEGNFQVTLSRAQMLAVWHERQARRSRNAPAPDQDKETVHAADAPQEGLTLSAAAPEPLPPLAIASDEPPTRTGPGRNGCSLGANADGTQTDCQPGQDPDAKTKAAEPEGPDTSAPPQPKTPVLMPAKVRDYIIERMAQQYPPASIAEGVERKFRLTVDRDEILVCWRDRFASPAPTPTPGSSETRTGPGPEAESRPRLSDEVKTFIVQRLACYETPSRVAAAVRLNFGIEIDRRRVFDYHPKSAPAQRWIDLHAATRARLLADVSDIAVAQKVIRLQMLDRFAQQAEDENQHDKAAKYLAQAARECGGFYDKQPLANPTGPRPTIRAA